MKNLFDYQKSTFQPEVLTDQDYNEIFTKEAAKVSSFKELEETINERLLPELNKWAERIKLDRNKLRSLFNDEKVDN